MKNHALASVIEKLQETKAYIDDCAKVDETRAMIDYIDRRISYVQDSINYFAESLGRHMEGHLPPIAGAGQMAKALKALGLSDDYDVQKRVIYANDGTATGFTLTFTPKAE